MGGKTVTLGVIRDGKEQEVSVTKQADLTETKASAAPGLRGSNILGTASLVRISAVW